MFEDFVNIIDVASIGEEIRSNEK